MFKELFYKLRKRILYLIFYILDHIIPKNKNMIVFASQSGKRYFDNSKYLYEYFMDNYFKSYEIYWFTFSENVRKKIYNKYPYANVIFGHSLKSLYTLWRAKNIVYCYSRGDLGELVFSKNTNIIYLDHGISLKGIGITDKKFTKRKKKNLIKKETSKYSLVISSSPTEKSNLAVSWGININIIKITGYPRNDVLIRKSKDLSDKFKFLNKRVILYAPTFRDGYVTRFFPFDDLNLKQINEFLINTDSYLLLRGHATETIYNKNSKTKYFVKNYERIVEFNQDKLEDVNELLPFVDLLITDYSGIYIDYLLLKRPIIFIPYDIKLYMKKRGLLFNYDAVTPGPKVFTQKDLLKEILLFFKNGNKYQCEREVVRNLFHTYKDFNYCNRVANEIIDLMKKDINE